MPEDIFEESKITIKATLKEGGIFSGDYTGKLDLIYQKNDLVAIEKDADIDVPKGSVDRTYDVPKVAGTEDTYNLKVIAHYGKTKEKTRVLVDATVWPKKMKLTAKDFKDDSPVKKLPYNILHTTVWFGGTTSGNTNDSGIGNEDLKKSPYTIEIKAPWEIVTNKNDAHKREHDLVVRNNPLAKFLKPDLSKDCYIPAKAGTDKKLGVRQYVNMTTAEEGCDAKGNIVEFEVCLKEKGQGVKDDKIYIQVKFTKLSKRDAPKPALLAPCQDIAEKDGGKTFTGFVQLDGDGGSAKFKLELGYAGGETFTVTCGYSKADPVDDKLIFVSWRKLGYQLRFPTIMKARMTERTRADGTKYFDVPDSIQNFVVARLAPVFVEYENIKSHEYPNPGAGAAAIIKKGFMDQSTDTTDLYVLNHDSKWAVTATPFDAVADNREIQVTLCDRAVLGDKLGKTIAPKLQLKAADSEHIIDPDADFIYFVKTPLANDTDNFVVAGYEWEADLSGVAATDKMKKPSSNAAFAVVAGGEPLSFSISEPSVGGPAITVACDDKNALQSSEKSKIKTYYEACFTDPKRLRRVENKLRFEVAGAAGNEGSRAVLAAIGEIHLASDKKILFHPGLDDDGNPRKGPMSDVTITHTNGRKKRFTLAAGGADKPGDFAGDPSATKCPIYIEFRMDGTREFYGNAGSGQQFLVLRGANPGPCSSTVCHELGHAMGMAVMPLTGVDAYPVPPGLPTPKHVDNRGWYYRNGSAPYTGGIRNLHVGSHCAHGMPGGNRSDPTFNGWNPSVDENGCIMWGSGGDDDTQQQYCTVCTDVLKARKLTDIRGVWLGRADG